MTDPVPNPAAPATPPVPAAQPFTPSAVPLPIANSQQPIANSPQPPSVEQMREALKEIYDPEIPINIVDLGLIYKVELRDGVAHVQMTLTSPLCPLGYEFKEQVERALRAMPGVKDAVAELVFEPLWTKDKMTADGKLQAAMLGFL